MSLDLSLLDDVNALLKSQEPGKGIRHVRVDAIRPDPEQPRKNFEQEALDELAASIQSIGIIQPPVVRSEGGGYKLISGERRWRAALQLGWETIDVIVRDDLNTRAQLVENIQREALSHWEIYRVISAELAAGTTQAELGCTLGKSRTWVAAYAAVDSMPASVVSVLREGRISGITALAHLHRLHEEMPEAAAQLLASSKPISRSMIEQARSTTSLLQPAAVAIVPPSREPHAKHIGRESYSTFEATAADVNNNPVRSVEDSASTHKSVARLPICIRVHHGGSNWIVDYGCQREIDGTASVRLNGEDGSKFAPLEALRLQSIEWL